VNLVNGIRSGLAMGCLVIVRVPMNVATAPRARSDGASVPGSRLRPKTTRAVTTLMYATSSTE